MKVRLAETILLNRAKNEPLTLKEVEEFLREHNLSQNFAIPIYNKIKSHKRTIPSGSEFISFSNGNRPRIKTHTISFQIPEETYREILLLINNPSGFVRLIFLKHYKYELKNLKNG